MKKEPWKPGDASTLGKSAPTRRDYPDYDSLRAAEVAWTGARRAELADLASRLLTLAPLAGKLDVAPLREHHLENRSASIELVARHARRPNPGTVTLSLDGYRNDGRLIISARLPFELAPHRENDELPSITVAEDRPLLAIAKEIARRVLPGLILVSDRAAIRKDKADGIAYKRSANVAKLLATGLFHPPRNEPSDSYASAEVYETKAANGLFSTWGAKVTSHDTVEFNHFKVDVDDALAIFELLKSRHPAPEKCPKCEATGLINTHALIPPDSFKVSEVCDLCDGTGNVDRVFDHNRKVAAA